MKLVLLSFAFAALVMVTDGNIIPVHGTPFASPMLSAYPCGDSKDIIVWFDSALPPKERNQYYLYYNKVLPLHVSIEVKFNADVNIILQVSTANNAITPYSMRNGSRTTHQFRTSDPYHLIYGYKVKGTAPGSIPYVTSFKINNVEYCYQPNVGFLDAYVANTVDGETRQNCGRRKIEHTELIVNGAQTKPGDWPWHTALYKFDHLNRSTKYSCGGTLLSKNIVLTAAHCVSERGVALSAEILSVVLGKYNLYGGDEGSQEREVHRIIIHEDYQYRYLHNDIALLKLRTEVVYTDFIQPACLWYSNADGKLLTDEILGTVVGWGFNSNDTLSRTISKTQMPMVAQSVCMSSNPNFYTSILNDKKFCAGYRNLTSPCNGDSGSAFQVFIPDVARRTVDTRSPGTWLVRGIVSLTLSREDANICDPSQYVVYTDVDKFLTWIQNYLDDEYKSILINPAVSYTPCIGDYDINVNYEPGLPPEEENKYDLTISKEFPLHTNLIVQFDSDASVTLKDKSFARVGLNPDNSFTIRFFKPQERITFTVKGLTPGVVPYLTSVVINNQEYCTEPWPGYLDTYIQGFQDAAESPDRKPKGNCGRRQVTHTELIVNGATTKPGDWPWHVALYKIDHANIKYICGGTLISKNHVLTAAHCITLRSVPVLPETISVVLGKFNLIGGDTESQEREVYSLTVHKDFDHRRLENDIALLKLKSEAVFNDYIQPACLWYPKAVDRLPSSTDIFGTIVGWGFESTDALAPQLRQAKMPIVSESTCIKSNPLFYSKLLTNNNKFCAGYRNGTSACNGDSGSAFQVFLPDRERDDNPEAVGAWYVRGIVSVTLSRVEEAICNPEEYVVFTDVEKYKTWIDNYLI